MADNLNINNIHEKLPRDFLVFAGTGATYGTGLPESWTELLTRLHEKRPVQGVDLEELNEINYPAYAEMFFNEFGQDSDGYYNIIEEELKATKSLYGPLQLQIFYITGRIITTNFEDSFEKAFEIYSYRKKNSKTCKIQSLPNLDMAILNEDFCITYLHGKIKDKKIIFRTEEFTKYYPDDISDTSVLEDYLMNIYDKHTIVFVGIGFLDKYIRRMLGKIYTKLKLGDEGRGKSTPEVEVSIVEPAIRHYAFLKRGDSDSGKMLEDDLKSMAIGVIWYDEHVEVMKCFQRIEMSRMSYIPGELK